MNPMSRRAGRCQGGSSAAWSGQSASRCTLPLHARGGEEEAGEAGRRLCLWRDGGRETGMGEERVGSAVDARRRDARSPPSKTADTTRDFPADPVLDRIYLLRQLRTRTWSQAGNTQPGLRMAAAGAAAEAYYMAIWPPPPPFLFTFSSIYHIIMYFKCFNENRFRSTLHEFNINKSN